jgi:hypothetical protein
LLRERVKHAYPIGMVMLLGIMMLVAFDMGSPKIQHLIKIKRDTERATVVLNNESQLIPLKSLKGRKIVSVNTGSAYAAVFDSLLRNYTDVSSLVLYAGSKQPLTEELNGFNTVIIQVTPQSLNEQTTIDFINATKRSKEVIIAGFGNTGFLEKLNEITAPVIWSTEQTESSANYSAQVIFGGIASLSRLTDSICPRYQAGAGYSTEKIRLKYSIPEEVGMNSSQLEKIDRIMAEAISQHATPGAVVMVVKDGEVVFDKAYGKHTYENADSTRANDIYDLASVTKVAATTIAAMSLTSKRNWIWMLR